MTNVAGRSLELYFIDGRPDGMLTAEVFNWTGHLLMAPRTQIAAALGRKEARYTGVYLLLGEKDGEPRAYVGEGEDISERIRSHDIRKDWWTTAVLVTSAANNLHKAHVKYLEARLVEQARLVGRVTLDNGNTPPRPGLSEAAEANMEAFLDYLFMVLPALQIDMFVQSVRPSAAPATDTLAGDRVRFELVNRKHRLRATARLEGADFIVEAGSVARGAWEGRNTESSGYAQQRNELQRTGVLVPQGERCVFSKDYAFKSPSAAAAVVNGRPSNGAQEWRLEGGATTYREWEDQIIEAAQEFI
ncbi:MAG: GIY-YIG nuclease family protein [Phenylobacterium sp.]|uniref:GIY-YIG nuclease family protein n=1 Tax=Phenylobacterium sp. TaxID=1871053 RepID=UPI0025CB89BE|nr:GIY-YIG nuclease family protein [Phenylobacterium sp.]MCA6232974.1 GIY-YIG nuclease family protein [Phenylobacterium sp.]MCA6257253.1 GIY-YIG nuclease family protein [Phenylobacterium sp.]MCA6265260.1 GIY-YIG nuclease family protein [Phenylobacterium sp.]MCA6312566.1 GIY-YIG nuclease family protein [Phenylobacterium sp.]MCA6317955.1 GIY-YIG nuclease family protein [Phenylobacterium sp.]